MFVILLHIKQHKNCVVAERSKLSYYVLHHAGIVLPLIRALSVPVCSGAKCSLSVFEFDRCRQREFEGVFLPSILLYNLSQFGCTVYSQPEGLNVAEV
jgi:hypothetical protein